MRGILLWLLASTLALCECSDYISQAQLNEVFVGKNDVKSSSNWVEIKLLNNDLNISDWQMQISQSASITQTFDILDSIDSNGSYLSTKYQYESLETTLNRPISHFLTKQARLLTRSQSMGQTETKTTDHKIQHATSSVLPTQV